MKQGSRDAYGWFVAWFVHALNHPRPYALALCKSSSIPDRAPCFAYPQQPFVDQVVAEKSASKRLFTCKGASLMTFTESKTNSRQRRTFFINVTTFLYVDWLIALYCSSRCCCPRHLPPEISLLSSLIDYYYRSLLSSLLLCQSVEVCKSHLCKCLICAVHTATTFETHFDDKTGDNNDNKQ